MGTTLLLKTNYSIDDTKSVVSEASEEPLLCMEDIEILSIAIPPL